MAHDIKVPMLDLKKQLAPLRQELIAAATQTIDSGWFLLGNNTQEFESSFAQWVGTRHAAGCANGTDAITLALWALGVGPGDEVITVPNTAFPTACAIARAGATPVFVDIDPHTWLIDPEQAAAAVTQRTRAIVPVHLFGNVVDIPQLRALIPKDIAILEDCAQAHGSKLNDVKAGAMGDLAAFSFYPSKNLGGLGDGGIVVTNSASLDTIVRQERFYGQQERDLHIHSGMNSRLDEIQAAFLSIELKYLDNWLDIRRSNAAAYMEGLQEFDLSMPKTVPGGLPSFHLFVTEVMDRSEFQAHLNRSGIQTGIHYPTPIHLQPAFKDLGFQAGDFPISESLAQNIVSFPVGPHLKQQDIDFVIECCREFFWSKK